MMKKCVYSRFLPRSRIVASYSGPPLVHMVFACRARALSTLVASQSFSSVSGTALVTAYGPCMMARLIICEDCLIPETALMPLALAEIHVCLVAVAVASGGATRALSVPRPCIASRFRVSNLRADLTFQQEIIKFLGVRALPVFYAYKNGKEVGKVQGAFPAKMLVRSDEDPLVVRNG